MKNIFPQPKYLGAKFKLLDWIGNCIPSNINVVFDAFSGSQSVAYYLKQRGFKTYTNDFLNFNNQIGLALIENNNVILTDDDINNIIQPIENDHFIEKMYCNLFFEKDDCVFLDNCRANIEKMSIYKKALAFSIINRAMTRKITMGHFAHTKAIEYMHNDERIKRNKSLVIPLKEIFLELLPSYNDAVFDNGKENKSFCDDALNILPHLKDIDLIYIDPPYCTSHADYQNFYHLLETYVNKWTDKTYINSIKRYEPRIYSGFDKKCDVIHSFEKLFELSKDIPHWLISYNNRSYPNIDIFKNMIDKYKDVEIKENTYTNSNGGKGSVKESKELLFVCSPKK